MSDLLPKIQVFADRAAQLEEKLAEPSVAANPAEYAKLAKELSGLRPAANAAAEYRKLLADLEGAQAMLEDGDADLRELAKSEMAELEPRRAELEQRVRILLIPRDENDEKNAILEIRAGTGGTEAALFAYDLFRMYGRYAERRGWKVEPLSLSESEAGGVKEVIAAVSGESVFHRLKHERGVHRVQRVPTTESQGRIHTSTVTVAVLPEAEEVDIQINPVDLRIDVFRSSGPGGQSVNTTDSAVRLTHIPPPAAAAGRTRRGSTRSPSWGTPPTATACGSTSSSTSRSPCASARCSASSCSSARASACRWRCSPGSASSGRCRCA